VLSPDGARSIGWQTSNRWPTLATLPYLVVYTAPREKTEMPTRNISLTDEQDAFVERVVKAGEYQNASEAIRDALRVLQRRREDELKLKALRAQIKAGVDALDQGNFVEVDDADLDGYLEGLTATRQKPAR
jgi:antitoxin ParD1/3/4